MKSNEQKQIETGAKSISQDGFLLSRMNAVLSLIVAFSCFSSAQAEVIIYKHAICVTDRSDGLKDKMRFSGWTVMDIQTGQLGMVRILGNNFGIEKPVAALASIGKAKNADAVGIIAVKDGYMSGLTARGKNKSVDIGLSQNWIIPRTLAVTGSQLAFWSFSDLPPVNPGGPVVPTGGFPGAGYGESAVPGNPGGFFPGPLVQTNTFSLHWTTQELFKQFNGSLVYDSTNTVQANSESRDFAATLLNFKNLLLEEGYVFQGEEEEELELIHHESNPL